MKRTWVKQEEKDWYDKEADIAKREKMKGR